MAKVERRIPHIEPLLVSSDRAAELLGIGHALFYQMKADGRLGPTALSFGKRQLYSVEELRAWVRTGCISRRQWEKIRNEARIA